MESGDQVSGHMLVQYENHILHSFCGCIAGLVKILLVKMNGNYAYCITYCMNGKLIAR